MGKKPHVIVIPFPAQGHVAPLMKLAYHLADHGVKVTFVNTESIHQKILSAVTEEVAKGFPINLVSIPDGWDYNVDLEADSWKALEIAPKFLRVHLQSLIENLNQDHQVTHVIADINIGWALEVSKKMFINTIAFVPYGVGNLAIILHSSKLIETGVIDAEGIPIKDEPVSLSEEIPVWEINELLWSIRGNPELQKFLFRNFVRDIGGYFKMSDSVIVNSFSELEQPACKLIPSVITIGPLFMKASVGTFPGNLWPEDSNCLNWLDQQPPDSVIYAAYGSSVVCNQKQLKELALGLEMTGKPFLWVVRSDFGNEGINFPDGFIERTENYAKIVKWAPQEKVLAHPSVGCFFSHCGWNSTIEGASMGVPILCWPYCVDQFHNREYICKAWKVGLGVIPDENGIVTRHEIKTQIVKLLRDEEIKANSLKLKEMARETIKGGSSYKNFMNFVEQIKQ